MKIGLALAGGGLKGVAHIGVIRALEELGVKIDFVSGTSSGSLMAMTFACRIWFLWNGKCNRRKL